MKKNSIGNILDRIQEIMARFNLNQKEFAKKISFSERTITLWFTKKKISPGGLRKIAGAFDINLKWLKEGNGLMFLGVEPNYNLQQDFISFKKIIGKKGTSEKMPDFNRPIRSAAPASNEWYIEAVRDILERGELATINALKANIAQFHEKIKKEEWMFDQIRYLRQEVKSLKNSKELSVSPREDVDEE